MRRTLRHITVRFGLVLAVFALALGVPASAQRGNRNARSCSPHVLGIPYRRGRRRRAVRAYSEAPVARCRLVPRSQCRRSAAVARRRVDRVYRVARGLGERSRRQRHLDDALGRHRERAPHLQRRIRNLAALESRRQTDRLPFEPSGRERLADLAARPCRR